MGHGWRQPGPGKVPLCMGREDEGATASLQDSIRAHCLEGRAVWARDQGFPQYRSLRQGSQPLRPPGNISSWSPAFRKSFLRPHPGSGSLRPLDPEAIVCAFREGWGISSCSA